MQSEWLQKNINTIILGDCLSIMQNIPNKSIDLIVTDPPYLVKYKTNRRKDKGHKFCKEIQNDDNPDLIKKVIKESYRVLKENTALYMFCNSNKADFFKKELEKYFSIKNMIIWVKNNHTAGDLQYSYGKQYEICFYANKGLRKINGKRITDVWDSRVIKGLNRVVNKEQIHQNQKPLELIKMMVNKSSDEGSLILDMFSGSGTTCIACKETGRNFIGIEIDEYYYDLSVNRLNGIGKNGQVDIFADFEKL